MKEVTVSFSTKFPDGSETPMVELKVDRPNELEEAVKFWGAEELVSLAVRDENSNVGNVCRAALKDALKNGKTFDEGKAIALEAGRAYEAGEKTRRAPGVKKAQLAAVAFNAQLAEGNQDALNILLGVQTSDSPNKKATLEAAILAWAEAQGLFAKVEAPKA